MIVVQITLQCMGNREDARITVRASRDMLKLKKTQEKIKQMRRCGLKCQTRHVGEEYEEENGCGPFRTCMTMRQRTSS